MSWLNLTLLSTSVPFPLYQLNSVTPVLRGSCRFPEWKVSYLLRCSWTPSSFSTCRNSDISVGVCLSSSTTSLPSTTSPSAVTSSRSSWSIPPMRVSSLSASMWMEFLSPVKIFIFKILNFGGCNNNGRLRFTIYFMENVRQVVAWTVSSIFMRKYFIFRVSFHKPSIKIVSSENINPP